MVIVILTAVPVGLRGFLTRWLLELAPGVFVGRVSRRIRAALWGRIIEMCKDGRALMVFQSDTEQRLEFLVHRHDWELVELDGVTLVKRPLHAQENSTNPMRKGWSKAAKFRRAGRK